MDVWQYIEKDNLKLPSIYFSHEREVVERNGVLLAVTEYISLLSEEKTERKRVRFRTVGDATCTGAIESEASEVDAIIREISALRSTERGTRVDDRRSETAMEDRKREGYF